MGEEDKTIDAKKYLRSIREMETAIEAKHEQIIALRTVAEKITVDVTSDSVQTTGRSDKVGKMAARIADLEVEHDDLVYELHLKKDEAGTIIDKIGREDYKLLLSMRYLNNRSWSEIERKMKRSYRSVNRYHGEAVAEFRKKFDLS